MKNFQNGRKNRIIYQLPFIFILFVVLIIFAVSVFSFAKRGEEAYSNRKISENKISELTVRKESLKKDIDELNTDFGKEKVFRENYGLGLPGEGVVVVVDQAPAPYSKPESRFMRFWHSLFGN